MSSLTDLRGVVDVVIGLDTHGHTNDIAAVGPTGAAQSQASRGHPLEPETDRAPSAQERSATRPGRAICGATRSITLANCD